MRLLLQRVSRASVCVDSKVVASIGRGYLLFLAVMEGDSEQDADWLARKVAALRLFEGDGGRVNDRSLLDIGGAALVVSQFTLAGSIEKGNRPDYTRASAPECAEKLYTYFAEQLRLAGIADVQLGQFGAMMQVSLVNDGPVTLWLPRGV